MVYQCLSFLNGLKCYFATDGYGNAFKNPYDAAGGNQVGYKLTGTAQKKGMINIRHVADGDVVTVKLLQLHLILLMKLQHQVIL